MEQKLRIEALKQDLRMSVEKNPSPKVITKPRLLTYVLLFALTPLGLYRLWRSDSEFSLGEKIVLTMISIIYLTTLYKSI